MYQSFFTLAEYEREGKDFRIVTWERDSPITIVAPHGGSIEPWTSEIAQALAGKEFSLYAFEGVKNKQNFDLLHITSDQFDEPRCVRMVGRSKIVVTVHGCTGHEFLVRVGGRDEKLKTLITEELRHTHLRVEAGAPGQAGAHAHNICNRGLSGRGIQLEISAGLRRKMLGQSEMGGQEGSRLFEDFIGTVRKVLVEIAKRETRNVKNPANK